MVSSTSLVVILVLVSFSNALISDFENIGSGFKDAWDQADSSNADFGFRAVFGGGKLYAVGQRRIRTEGDNILIPVPGGIVSIFNVDQKEWSSHQSHSLDIGDSNFTVFTLGSLLHMLTYSIEDNGIKFEKLFSWSDKQGQWSNVPLDINSDVAQPGDRPPVVYVSVPDQSGTTAYVIASASSDGSAAGAVSKLTIEFQYGTTIKATLKSVTILTDSDLKDIVFVGAEQDSLHAFARKDQKSGDSNTYWSVYHRFTVDPITGDTIGVPFLEAPLLERGARNDRIFQVKDKVIFIGIRLYGRGGNVPHIWAYDLNTTTVQDTNAGIPSSPLAIDQDNAKLYAVDFDKVTVATLKFQD
jgi:hypothetical protein